MADKVALNDRLGIEYDVGTDSRTVGGQSVEVQRVIDQGATAFATGQVSPTGTAATLLAARDTRKVVTFVNQGSINVWIGPATVTTANGFLLLPGASKDMETTALIQAITAGGTGSIHYEEDYDS